MIRELRSMVWILLVPWCLKNTETKKTKITSQNREREDIWHSVRIKTAAVASRFQMVNLSKVKKNQQHFQTSVAEEQWNFSSSNNYPKRKRPSEPTGLRGGRGEGQRSFDLGLSVQAVLRPKGLAGFSTLPHFFFFWRGQQDFSVTQELDSLQGIQEVKWGQVESGRRVSMGVWKYMCY